MSDDQTGFVDVRLEAFAIDGILRVKMPDGRVVPSRDLVITKITDDLHLATISDAERWFRAAAPRLHKASKTLGAYDLVREVVRMFVEELQKAKKNCPPSASAHLELDRLIELFGGAYLTWEPPDLGPFEL